MNNNNNNNQNQNNNQNKEDNIDKNNKEKNNKTNSRLKIFIIIMAILGIAIGTAAYVFSDDVIVNIDINKDNVDVNIFSLSFKDNSAMKNEIDNYVDSELNNVDSTVNSLKKGINKIAKSYGYSNININLQSQFGKDTLPMTVLVQGTSMVPTLQDGEVLIILKTNNIKVGDIVVAKDSESGLLVKRVGNISGSRVFLSADNNDTTTVVDNGKTYEMIAIEKWTNKSNIIGVAKVFNVQ